MKKLHLIALFYFLNINLYGQELYANKRATIALETMAQSQINIGGLQNVNINSDKLSVRSISFGVAPMFGMLFNLRTSNKSYISTGIRFGMYKTTAQVKFIIPDSYLTQKVIAKRIVLGAPIIYNTFITKKCVLGIGAEFFFDIADEIQLKTKFRCNRHFWCFF
ncbi:MAG: hypothetical protein H7331_04595, partial [Bacteroidia bacterium]|nr:hypothetical protein [Bacteroidia bacterium]